MTDADNFVCAASRMGDLQIAPAADWRPPLLVVLGGRFVEI
jgi:hypothetical protein